MAFHVYILRNPDGRLYTGQTQDLARRLKEHNDPADRTTLHTKKHPGPWLPIHTEAFATRSEAMRRERELKTGKGRDWIQQNILGENAAARSSVVE